MAGRKRTAKRKYEDEHKMFLPEWETSYFAIERNGKPFCLICKGLLAHFEASTIQRHFSSLHALMDQEFPKGTELRQHKLFTLKKVRQKSRYSFSKNLPSSQRSQSLHHINWLGTFQRLKSHTIKGSSLKSASVTLLISYPLKTAN